MLARRIPSSPEPPLHPHWERAWIQEIPRLSGGPRPPRRSWSLQPCWERCDFLLGADVCGEYGLQLPQDGRASRTLPLLAALVLELHQQVFLPRGASSCHICHIWMLIPHLWPHTPQTGAWQHLLGKYTTTASSTISGVCLQLVHSTLQPSAEEKDG